MTGLLDEGCPKQGRDFSLRTLLSQFRSCFLVSPPCVRGSFLNEIVCRAIKAVSPVRTGIIPDDIPFCVQRPSLPRVYGDYLRIRTIGNGEGAAEATPSFRTRLPEYVKDRRDQHEDKPDRYDKSQPKAEFSSAQCYDLYGDRRVFESFHRRTSIMES